MGWDVFCCICGNSCKGCDIEYLEEIFSYENIDKKKLKEIAKINKWTNKNNNITLLSNNTNVKNAFECERHLPYKDNNDYGILLHYDCWKFVKNTYDIELKYKHFPVNYIDLKNKNQMLGHPPFPDIDFGEIKKYWGQDMNYVKMYKDNKIFMTDSPLNTANTQNINRIKKIIKQYKFKKQLLVRPSPPISATFYKTNTIKIGNNNNFWIIRNGKWNEIKEDVIKKKLTIVKSNKFYDIIEIPRIGEYNNVPLFINQINEKKANGEIEFIGTEKSIKLVEKKYGKYMKK